MLKSNYERAKDAVIKASATVPSLKRLSGAKFDLQKASIYIIGEIKGGGTTDLFDTLSSNVSVVGITNFDGKELKSLRDFVGFKASIGYATSTETGEVRQDLTYSTVGAPAAIENAEFKFSVSDAVIVDTPVFMLHNRAVSQHNNITDLFYDLEEPTIIAAEQTLSAKVSVPPNATLDTAAGKRHFVRFAVDGYQIRQK